MSKKGEKGQNSAHNPKVPGSNPGPATNDFKGLRQLGCKPFFMSGAHLGHIFDILSKELPS
jgi:hypothetical protein